MLLYCIRHGESTYNAQGRVQGVQSPHSGKNRRIIAILSAEGLLVTGVIMAEISRNARGASGFSGAEGLS